jgi:hypothetical protein
MRIIPSVPQLWDPVGSPTIDGDDMAGALHRARKLRAEAFTRAFRAPWSWLHSRIARARAPMDFAPVGTCP